VLDVDLTDPNVRVGVGEAGDTITNPDDETVSSMAGRTHAVAGVNGDYFEIHASGRPLGGVISGGQMLKSPRPGFNAQLGVKPDGTMVIGRQTFSGTITVGSQSHALDSVNVVNDLAAGGITEVTAYLGASSGLPASTLVLGHAGTGDSFVVEDRRQRRQAGDHGARRDDPGPGVRRRLARQPGGRHGQGLGRAELPRHLVGRQATPLRSGTGRIFASNGNATTSQKLQVVDKLATLAVSPDTPDLNNSATQQFTLSGTTRTGAAVEIPAEAAKWSSSAEEIGKIDEHGFFTAADLSGGMVTVTANVAGTSATASVSVGSVSKTIDDMSSLDVWRLSNNTTGQPATLAADSDVPPGSNAPGSLKLSYTMPAGSGVKQLVLSPNVTLKTTTSDDGKTPTGIGLWIKGNGTGIMLAESYIAVNGTRTTIYPATVTWQGWHFAIAQLPAGMQFPLTISFVDSRSARARPRVVR
jgi:hypothetical protein